MSDEETEQTEQPSNAPICQDAVYVELHVGENFTAEQLAAFIAWQNEEDEDNPEDEVHPIWSESSAKSFRGVFSSKTKIDKVKEYLKI